MLISVHEHSALDLDAWARGEKLDRVTAASGLHKRRLARSVAALERFVAKPDGCYCGVSWGKDSVAVAHLVATVCPYVPLVWIRVEPICNPHCVLVRDSFLSMFPTVQYDEIRSDCWRDNTGWHASGTLERGFSKAEDRYGKSHISGIRSQESAMRKRRCLRFGESSETTCAPLAWWSSDDVFAHLFSNKLPVHPAYAMSMGGAIERGRLRVSSLGGQRGTGHGRTDWEKRYYQSKMIELGL